MVYPTIEFNVYTDAEQSRRAHKLAVRHSSLRRHTLYHSLYSHTFLIKLMQLKLFRTCSPWKLYTWNRSEVRSAAHPIVYSFNRQFTSQQNIFSTPGFVDLNRDSFFFLFILLCLAFTLTKLNAVWRLLDCNSMFCSWTFFLWIPWHSLLTLMIWNCGKTKCCCVALSLISSFNHCLMCKRTTRW